MRAHVLLPVLALAAACRNTDTSIGHFNVPPAVSLLSPEDGAEFELGEAVPFVARVSDDIPASELHVSWTSDTQGLLDDTVRADADGRVNFVTSMLEPGPHAITVAVTDDEGATSYDYVDVTILGDYPDEVPPEVVIEAPTSGQAFLASDVLDFRAQVSDAQDAPEDLLVEVVSDLEGTVCDELVVTPDGQATCAAQVGVGTHLFTFRATDLDGNVGEASVAARVELGPQDPVISILAPTSSDTPRENHPIDFVASVSDPQDAPSDLVATVTSDRDGAVCDLSVATDGTASCFEALSMGLHQLTFRVTDTDGNAAQASVAVQVAFDPQDPEIVIVAPTSSDTPIEGFPVDFEAVVSDPQDAASALDVTVTSDRDGAVCDLSVATDGTATCTEPLGGGMHVLTFEVSDTDGNTARATVAVDVTWRRDVDLDGDGYTPRDGDCNDDDALVSPGEDEWCDGQDTNCDGTVDGPDPVDGTWYFPDGDADGYGDMDHDGVLACAPPTASWTTDDTDCDDGDGTVNPGASDEPDDAFVDADCDDVDGDVDRAIFVSPSGSDSRGGLTPSAAVRSLGRAMQLAGANPSRTQILVASGAYSTSSAVSLRSGVGVHGGYASNFASRGDSRATLTASSATAVIAQNLTSKTVLDRVDVVTADRSGESQATLALRVLNSGSNLHLRFVDVTAGRGGAGKAGNSGSKGSDGGRGSNASGASGGNGGSGGGGDGADGRKEKVGLAGSPGNRNTASCGSGGGSGSGDSGMKCGDGDPRPGGNGQNGCTGSSGSHGAAADGTGSFTSGLWTPSTADGGTTGGRGGGGGGGGAGGGEDCWFPGMSGTGRGGGGGGGGGAGGTGGEPGTSGGASIALAIHNSTVVAHRLHLATNGGGNGGDGGSGGLGGNGGSGGFGASNSDNSEADGGHGGNGGSGGCGGGGAGGPSVGAWGSGSAAIFGTPTFAVASGGTGGDSCGNDGARGIRRDAEGVVVISL